MWSITSCSSEAAEELNGRQRAKLVLETDVKLYDEDDDSGWGFSVSINIYGSIQPFEVFEYELWKNGEYATLTTFSTAREISEFLANHAELPRINAEDLSAAEFWQQQNEEHWTERDETCINKRDVKSYLKSSLAKEYNAEMRTKRAFLDLVLDEFRAISTPVNPSADEPSTDDLSADAPLA
jgi:hypothetical protein